MMKFFRIIALTCMPLCLLAQLTVSVQLPPAGMIQKDQLWNLMLVNNSNEILDVAVSLNLQDAVTGQTVLSAGTRNFLLGKGVKMLNYRDIQPVQYNYLAAELSGNYIPLGSYVACYRVFKSEKMNEPLADECVKININPLTPPLLNTPADKSVLQTKYPLFNWIPPAPLEMFSDLNYDISVVEVLEGQSASEAMLNNVPVYGNNNIKNPFENFPSSYSSLEAGKKYAWQVTAKNGFNYSAVTDVWTFSLQSPDSVKESESTSAYLLMKNNSGSAGVNLISQRNLFIKYYSFDKEHETTIKILTADGKLMQEIRQKIIYGDNFLLFKLNRFFEEGLVYKLEIIDQQNNKYTVQFSIKKKNSSN